MTSNPIRLFRSPLTGRVYATRAYRVCPTGEVVITGQKFDVTDEVLTLAAEITKELGSPSPSGGSATQGEASGQVSTAPHAAASPTQPQPGLTPPQHTPEPSAPTSAPAVASSPTT